MLNIVVCVSGGGTNLQAIIDGIVKAIDLWQAKADEMANAEKNK